MLYTDGETGYFRDLKRLFLFLQDPSTIAPFVQALAENSLPALESFSIDATEGGDLTSVFDALAVPVCHQLRHFDLDIRRDDGRVHQHISTVPFLAMLKARRAAGCPGFPSIPFFVETDCKNPDAKLDAIRILAPTLTTFDTRWEETYARGATAFSELEGASEVKHLRLLYDELDTAMSQAKEMFLQAMMAGKMPALQTLHVCDFETSEGNVQGLCAALTSVSSSLQTFHMEDCAALPEEVWKCLGPNVKTLKLHSCWILPPAMPAFVACLPASLEIFEYTFPRYGGDKSEKWLALLTALRHAGERRRSIKKLSLLGLYESQYPLASRRRVAGAVIEALEEETFLPNLKKNGTGPHPLWSTRGFLTQGSGPEEDFPDYINS